MNPRRRRRAAVSGKAQASSGWSMRRGTSWRAHVEEQVLRGQRLLVVGERPAPEAGGHGEGQLAGVERGDARQRGPRSVDTTPSPPSHVVAAASASSVWFDSKGIRRTRL